MWWKDDFCLNTNCRGGWWFQMMPLVEMCWLVSKVFVLGSSQVVAFLFSFSWQDWLHGWELRATCWRVWVLNPDGGSPQGYAGSGQLQHQIEIYRWWQDRPSVLGVEPDHQEGMEGLVLLMPNPKSCSDSGYSRYPTLYQSAGIGYPSPFSSPGRLLGSMPHFPSENHWKKLTKPPLSVPEHRGRSASWPPPGLISLLLLIHWNIFQAGSKRKAISLLVGERGFGGIPVSGQEVKYWEIMIPCRAGNCLPSQLFSGSIMSIACLPPSLRRRGVGWLFICDGFCNHDALNVCNIHPPGRDPQTLWTLFICAPVPSIYIFPTLPFCIFWQDCNPTDAEFSMVLSRVQA